MSVGVADLLSDWATTVRRQTRTRQTRLLMFRVSVLGVAAIAAWATEASPTGYHSLDKAYVAGLAATTAYFGGTARRWTWFLPAGVGAALAADEVAVALAGVALALGFWSVLSNTRTPARSAIVVGLGVAAAMRTGPVGFHGATALLVGVFLLPVIVSGYRNANRRVKRRARQVALGLGVLVGLVLAGAAVALATVGNDLMDGMDLADEGIVAARDADDELATQRLTEASRLLNSTSGTLEGWFVSPARALPVVGPNLRAVERLTHEVGDLAGVSAAAAAASDVELLRVNDGRLSPDAVANVKASLDSVEGSVKRAQVSVKDVSSPWLLAPITEQMDRLSTELDGNLPDVAAAREAVDVAHSLLAPGGTRRYLVLFVSPVETRGRTGFPGNYAELLVEDGKITMPRFGRVSELEQRGTPGAARKVEGPLTEEYLRRYGPFDPLAIWRNVTMSPDLPTIADVVRQIYPQSGGEEIEGLLTVDPAGLAALMKFTPPINVAELPYPLTADNTEDFLQIHQYVAYPDTSQRIDVLGEVARQTFEQLLAAELPSPKTLVDTLSPAVKGGHIQFTTFTPTERTYFDKIGISGAFTPKAGQVLAVVNNNAGGNKLDAYLQRSLRYEAMWDPATNTIAGKITVQLHNSAAAESDLPDYVVGNLVDLPEGTNRTYLSVYTGHLLDAARLNGQPVNLQSQSELTANVYSTFVDVPPQGTVTLELDVHGTLAYPGLFSFNLMPQPLVETEQVDLTLSVAGTLPLTVGGDAEGATVEGRTVHWNGPLEQAREIYVDTTGLDPAELDLG